MNTPAHTTQRPATLSCQPFHTSERSSASMNMDDDTGDFSRVTQCSRLEMRWIGEDLRITCRVVCGASGATEAGHVRGML